MIRRDKFIWAALILYIIIYLILLVNLIHQYPNGSNNLKPDDMIIPVIF